MGPPAASSGWGDLELWAGGPCPAPSCRPLTPTPALQGLHLQNALDPSARRPLLLASREHPSRRQDPGHLPLRPPPQQLWGSQLGPGMVRHLCPHIGCGVESALEAASLHPARLLGLEKHKGTLDFGADAGQGPRRGGSRSSWEAQGRAGDGGRAGSPPTQGSLPGQRPWSGQAGAAGSPAGCHRCQEWSRLHATCDGP